MSNRNKVEYFEDGKWHPFFFPSDWEALKSLAVGWGIPVREIDEDGVAVREFHPIKNSSTEDK